jgi:surfeit locus 1 family protein
MAANVKARSGFPVVLTLFTVAALVLLVGLGVWQIKRLHWKEALLARIAAAEDAPPEPLEVVLRRIPDGVDADYNRVQVDCPAVEQTPFLKLYSVTDAGAGYRIITACRIVGAPYASILIDRGFIAQDLAPALAAAKGALLDQPVVGLLRKGDPPTFVTPPNQPGQGLWYWRDIPAMAKALGAPDAAPTFLMLQQPQPKGPGPTPMAVPTDIPNNHLQYALTWFGLAAGLAGVYLASLWRRLR